MIYNNILELIGNTPLVKINKLNPNYKVTLLAKLEFFNPGGSIKDRIGLEMINSAEKNKKLSKNGVIVEATGAGNTGLGLVITAAVKGYKTILVIPDKVSDEKSYSRRGRYGNRRNDYRNRKIFEEEKFTNKDHRSRSNWFYLLPVL